MTKKSKQKKEAGQSQEAKAISQGAAQSSAPQAQNGLPPLPKEVQERIAAIKDKIDSFQKQTLEKFDKYILGTALLPPPKQMPGAPPLTPEQQKQVHILVLVDDSDSKRMPKHELHEKLYTIIDKIARDIDPILIPQVLLISDLWQNCYDAKYEWLEAITLSAPLFDRGMLAAVKIADIHRGMVLKKFERYIVSYILAGSLVQGTATHQSDIDVALIVDDTDVKKMTRAELRDKLRAIIISMGFDAGSMTGIKNKINIQVWLLTDFWDGLREANPVYFTMLRDGVPFYDRGVFMPWKQLLRMGKIRPSPEAIDMYMNSGEQMIERAKFKIREIGIEDVFWATSTPSQAALMMYGVPPPTPRELGPVMREIFVKQEKLLDEKDIAVMEKIVGIRKDMEHGTKKEFTGKEADALIAEAEAYLKRIKRLFTQIDSIKEKEAMLNVYDSMISLIRDVLRAEGEDNVPEAELIKLFEDKCISTGKVPAKLLRLVNAVLKGRQNYDAGKLTKNEVEQVRKEATELMRSLIEYLQRKRGRELERAKIRVKYGSKYGEVTLLEDKAYVVLDLDAETKQVQKGTVQKDGRIGTLQDSTLEEFEKDMVTAKFPPKVFVKEPLFERLKEIFGKDVEVMVGY